MYHQVTLDPSTAPARRWSQYFPRIPERSCHKESATWVELPVIMDDRPVTDTALCALLGLRLSKRLVDGRFRPLRFDQLFVQDGHIFLTFSGHFHRPYDEVDDFECEGGWAVPISRRLWRKLCQKYHDLRCRKQLVLQVVRRNRRKMRAAARRKFLAELLQGKSTEEIRAAGLAAWSEKN